MTSQRNVERLAAQLSALERRLRTVEVQPQLANSSITGGSLNVYTPSLPDGVGTPSGAQEFEELLRTVVGRLPDGTHGTAVVNGPPPPTPSTPIVESAVRGALVRWNGYNADGTDVQPMDWSRLEVHARPGGIFTPQPSSLRGTIETPQGGTLVVSAGLDYDPAVDSTITVRFVARNTSGTASPPSEAVTVSVGKVENFDLADFSVTVKKFVSLRHFLY